MSNIQHRDIPVGGVHGTANWVVSNEAARAALSGLVSGDLHKVCYVTDTSTYYCLVAVSPAHWKSFSGFLDINVKDYPYEAPSNNSTISARVQIQAAIDAAEAIAKSHVYTQVNWVGYNWELTSTGLVAGATEILNANTGGLIGGLHPSDMRPIVRVIIPAGHIFYVDFNTAKSLGVSPAGQHRRSALEIKSNVLLQIDGMIKLMSGLPSEHALYSIIASHEAGIRNSKIRGIGSVGMLDKSVEGSPTYCEGISIHPVSDCSVEDIIVGPTKGIPIAARLPYFYSKILSENYSTIVNFTVKNTKARHVTRPDSNVVYEYWPCIYISGMVSGEVTCNDLSRFNENYDSEDFTTLSKYNAIVIDNMSYETTYTLSGHGFSPFNIFNNDGVSTKNVYVGEDDSGSAGSMDVTNYSVITNVNDVRNYAQQIVVKDNILPNGSMDLSLPEVTLSGNTCRNIAIKSYTASDLGTRSLKSIKIHGNTLISLTASFINTEPSTSAKEYCMLSITHNDIGSVDITRHEGATISDNTFFIDDSSDKVIKWLSDSTNYAFNNVCRLLHGYSAMSDSSYHAKFNFGGVTPSETSFELQYPFYMNP